MISSTFAILFLSGNSIHGGGPSTFTNIIVFSIYSSEGMCTVLENKNYRRGHICTKCLDFKDFKEKVGGGLFPSFEEEDYDINVGELLYHFNIKRHGFCILKVTNTEKLTQEIITEVKKIESGGKGVSYI